MNGLLLVLGILALSNGASSRDLAATDWPMFQGDAAHTGRGALIQTHWFEVRITFPTGGAVDSSPIVGQDRQWFFGSRDHVFYALSNQGQLLWSRDLGAPITSAAALRDDDILLVAPESSTLYALKGSSGAVRWSYTAGNWFGGSPVIGAGNTAYVGNLDNNLYAFDTNGAVAWTYPTGGSINNAPALDPGGRILFASNDTGLYSLDSDGTLAWSYTLEAPAVGAPTINEADTVYLGDISANSAVYAVDLNGSLRWKKRYGATITGSFGLARDGSLFFGTRDRVFYKVDPDGNLAFIIPIGQAIDRSSPALSLDDGPVFGCFDNKLYALDAQGALQWSFQAGSYINSSPAVTSRQEIAFGSGDYNFYVLAAVTATPSPTPTPTTTPTVTPTASPSPTMTPTPPPTPTWTPTRTPTPTPSVTLSPTVSPTPSATFTLTPTGTPSSTPTSLPTGTPTSTPSPTPSGTPSGTPTPSPTLTPSITPTLTPTISPTGSPTNTPTDTPTQSPTPTATFVSNPPYVFDREPPNGAPLIDPGARVSFHIRDDEEGVDLNTVLVTINRRSVVATVVDIQIPFEYSYQYFPVPAFPKQSVVVVEVEACDLGRPSHCMTTDTYSFTIAGNTPTPTPTPFAGAILVAGYLDTTLTEQDGGTLKLLAIPERPLSRLEIFFQGAPTGVLMGSLGDGSYYFSLQVPAGVPAPTRLALELRGFDGALTTGLWPYLTVP